MNKLIFILCLLSLSAFAADPAAPTEPQTEFTPDLATPPKATVAELPASNLISKDVTVNNFNPYKSHWISTFGFEGSKYDNTANYKGLRKEFNPGKVEIWGPRVGIGGEMYLGAGLMTATRLEGYYLGTLFSRTLNASPDANTNYSHAKTFAGMYGGDISQTLSWLFDFKTKHPFLDHWTYLTVEPFVEAGIGVGQSIVKTNYAFNTDAAHQEYYYHKMQDRFISRKVAAGVMFTASSGFFLQVKVTSTMLDITKRTDKSSYLNAADSSSQASQTTDIKNATIHPLTVYTLGGGYKF